MEPAPATAPKRSAGTVTPIDSESPRTAAKITGVRPDVVGIFLTLICPTCDYESESYQPTIAGFAAGTHTCARCSTVYEVEQKDLETALERYWPRGSLEAMTQLTTEATRIAETWHDAPELTAVLVHAGVHLGPAMERELLAFIVAGLFRRPDPEATR